MNFLFVGTGHSKGGAGSAPLSGDTPYTGISSVRRNTIVTLTGMALPLVGGLVGAPIEQSLDLSDQPQLQLTASATSLNQIGGRNGRGSCLPAQDRLPLFSTSSGDVTLLPAETPRQIAN